jgi:hypothetical protein
MYGVQLLPLLAHVRIMYNHVQCLLKMYTHHQWPFMATFTSFLGKGPSVTERPSRTLPSTRHNRIEGQTLRSFVLAEHS